MVKKTNGGRGRNIEKEKVRFELAKREREKVKSRDR